LVKAVVLSVLVGFCYVFVATELGGVAARTLDLQSICCEFKCRSVCYQVVTSWMGYCLCLTPEMQWWLHHCHHITTFF